MKYTNHFYLIYVLSVCGLPIALSHIRLSSGLQNKGRFPLITAVLIEFIDGSFLCSCCFGRGCSSSCPETSGLLTSLFFFMPLWCSDPILVHGLSLRGFVVTLRNTTVGGTPLDEWSVRRRELYLTTHNTHCSGSDKFCVSVVHYLHVLCLVFIS